MWHYLYKRQRTAVQCCLAVLSLLYTHAEMANTACRRRSPLLLQQLRLVGDAGDQLQKGTAQEAKRQHVPRIASLITQVYFILLHYF